MFNTKQKQLQQFNMYPQVPAARPQIPPLLPLPPGLQAQQRPGQRIPNRSPLCPPASPLMSASRSPSLLGPTPMMPPAMMMHQMGGMPAGCGKRFQPPFLTPGGGQSLLGPAPVGTPLRNTHIGFIPRHPPRPHGLYKNMEGSLHVPVKNRENGYVAAGNSNGQINRIKTDVQTAEKDLKVSEESQTLGAEQTSPPVKKQKIEGADEPVEISEEGHTEKMSVDEELPVVSEQSEDLGEGEELSAEPEEDLEQSRTAEVQGVGTSLKVTIQRSSESRAFSTRPEETAASASMGTDKEKSKTTSKFTCHICNVGCPDQQEFQKHMISLGHQQKLMEIQHMSSTCLATLLPKMQHSVKGTQRERVEGPQRWCAICQCHFTGDLIEHRRTEKHKMAKVSSRPFCTVCERHFKTPRKFVEHMKSPEHKQRVEELREEGGSEAMEELITVDAIGCFEGEDDYEEEGNEDEEEDTVSEKDVNSETNDKKYDPDTQYGTSFVVPVAGFLCKLCHKFYHYESSARETHCKSLLHYHNLQKYKAMVNTADKEDENSPPVLDAEDPDESNDCSSKMEDKGEEDDKKETTTTTSQSLVTNPREEKELLQPPNMDLSSKPAPQVSVTPKRSGVAKNLATKTGSDGGSVAQNQRPVTRSQKS